MRTVHFSGHLRGGWCTPPPRQGACWDTTAHGQNEWLMLVSAQISLCRVLPCAEEMMVLRNRKNSDRSRSTKELWQRNSSWQFLWFAALFFQLFWCDERQTHISGSLRKACFMFEKSFSPLSSIFNFRTGLLNMKTLKCLHTRVINAIQGGILLIASYWIGEIGLIVDDWVAQQIK